MSTSRPNILFLLTDDQAPWTLGAEGRPNAFTPALDRLAAGGVRLARMFANAAICSPSRATLLTGRYPTETGFGPDGCVYIEDEARSLHPELPSWPALLREAGVRTALVGKWHLGHAREAQLPTARGYERFRGWLVGGERSRDPRIQIDGAWRDFPGRYTPDVLTDLALETIRDWRDQPFALSLHYWAPHANVAFPEGYTPPHDDRTWLPLRKTDLAPWTTRDLAIPNPDFPNLDRERIDRMAREYHASVHSVDRNVGRVLDLLEELGLAENTLVVFTSDQGYNLGHNGIWHKGNGRWITRDRRDPRGVYPGSNRPNLYDNSMRVPCLLRWPARLPAGTVDARPASFLDWLPTLLAAAGVTPPADLTVRGRNLLPRFAPGGDALDGDARVHAQHDCLRCCRTARWKYIFNALPGQPDELYDLAADPEEHQNLLDGPLASDAAAAHAELRRDVRDWMEGIADPLLTQAHPTSRA